jgi:hypothetical protein
MDPRQAMARANEKRHRKQPGGQDDSALLTQLVHDDLAAETGKETASGGEEVIPDERDAGDEIAWQVVHRSASLGRAHTTGGKRLAVLVRNGHCVGCVTASVEVTSGDCELARPIIFSSAAAADGLFERMALADHFDAIAAVALGPVLLDFYRIGHAAVQVELFIAALQVGFDAIRWANLASCPRGGEMPAGAPCGFRGFPPAQGPAHDPSLGGFAWDEGKASWTHSAHGRPQ